MNYPVTEEEANRAVEYASDLIRRALVAKGWSHSMQIAQRANESLLEAQSAYRAGHGENAFDGLPWWAHAAADMVLFGFKQHTMSKKLEEP